MEINEKYFDTDRIRIRYIEGPESGPPLVMLHGATGNCEAWNKLLPDLTRHWHVYALDLRGHGQSGWGTKPEDYHVSQNVNDIVDFLRMKVTDKVVLFGHSWGGVIALFCGAPAKEHLRGLILEDPPLFIRRPNTESKPFLDYFTWIYQTKQTARTVEEMSAAILAANPAGVPPEILEPWAKRLIALDSNVLLATLAGSMVVKGIDLERSIQEITCPILLLQADPAAGSAFAQEDVDWVLKNARDARLLFYPGAGHMIHDDQPAEFLRVFSYFR